jgi:hypothetical protein
MRYSKSYLHSTKRCACSVSVYMFTLSRLRCSLGTASAHVMIREATEDTVLTVPNPPGKEGFTTLPVQKGAQVIMALLPCQNLLTG